MPNILKCTPISIKRYKLYLKACMALLFINSTGSAIAANEEFSINNAQAVEVIKEQRGDQTFMSVSAFGQTFNLLMQKNNSLMNKLPSDSIDAELYSGTIENVAGSWARISKINGGYSGAIYDGYELYMLDDGDMVAESVDADSKETMQNSDTVMYKASGMSSSMFCGDDHGDHDGHQHERFSYKNFVSELKQQQAFATAEQSIAAATTASATASRQVNLNIVLDTQYAASSSDPRAQVLSQMNIVDGIFTEQIGVQFGIQDINILNNNGPLTATNSSTLLMQFRNFVSNNNPGNNPGLTHLFTGKDLDGGVIGVAVTRGICTSSGLGLTQAGGRGTIGALTAAHEFGHNFGSPHDNQAGSACASTGNNFLMNPSINGSDQFSACSRNQINTIINSNRGSCLVGVEPTPTQRLVHIRKRNATGFAIDGNRGAENRQSIYLWSQSRNNQNQQWIEIDRGNGFFSYQKNGTNHCIDGNNGGADRQDVYLWSCSANNQNQHWRKVSVGGGAVQLVKRNAQGFALNGGNNGANAQNVNLFNSSNTSQNLHWVISPL